MKQYHTHIEISRPPAEVWRALTDFDKYPEWNPLVGELKGPMVVGEKISTHIIPLGRTYRPRLLAYSEREALTWQGAQGAKFLLAGKHYYKLKPGANGGTLLEHGEYFTGLFSAFIGKGLLKKMENAFRAHNVQLKMRLEQ